MGLNPPSTGRSVAKRTPAPSGGAAPPVSQAIIVATGAPEGVTVGNIGDLYVNRSGGAGSTIYVKESGAGTSTGWIAATTSGAFGAANISTTGTLSAGATTVASLRDTALGVGLMHSDSSGNATSSLAVNADVDANAAIAGSKVSPSFGSQNISTTGTLAAGASTLGNTTCGTLGAGTSTLGNTTLTANGNPATLSAGACTLGATTCTTLGATAVTCTSLQDSALGAGSVRSSAQGTLSIVTAQSITGQLSNVTDANAKAVLTSIINALTAAAPGPAIATNNTT